MALTILVYLAWSTALAGDGPTSLVAAFLSIVLLVCLAVGGYKAIGASNGGAGDRWMVLGYGLFVPSLLVCGLLGRLLLPDIRSAGTEQNAIGVARISDMAIAISGTLIVAGCTAFVMQCWRSRRL